MDEEEHDTFMRNVRLSIDLPVILAFGVNPIVSGLYLWYSVSYQTDDGYFSRRTQIWFPAVYMMLSTSLLPFAVKEYEQERLKKLGYEQRASLLGRLDWVLNVAILLGVTYWMKRWDVDGWSKSQARWALFFNAVTFYLGFVLAFMGPIWLWTKRVR